jgi:predicted nuclease of restriction endonuclease-like (RecB) superfamily
MAVPPPPIRHSFWLAGINLPPSPLIDGDDFEELDEVRDEERYEEYQEEHILGKSVLELGPDFHFSYSDQHWLPPVHDQGSLRKFLICYIILD